MTDGRANAGAVADGNYRLLHSHAAACARHGARPDRRPDHAMNGDCKMGARKAFSRNRERASSRSTPYGWMPTALIHLLPSERGECADVATLGKSEDGINGLQSQHSL